MTVERTMDAKYHFDDMTEVEVESHRTREDVQRELARASYAAVVSNSRLIELAEEMHNLNKKRIEQREPLDTLDNFRRAPSLTDNDKREIDEIIKGKFEARFGRPVLRIVEDNTTE